jgi:hypothetical protein
MDLRLSGETCGTITVTCRRFDTEYPRRWQAQVVMLESLHITTQPFLEHVYWAF